MAAYILTNKHGCYIGYDKESNKYIKVHKRANSHMFDSRTKAKNVLNNSLAKELRNIYHVFEVDEDDFKSFVKSKSKNTHGKSPAEVKRNTKIADERYKNLNDQLSNVDKEICDLNHYIEFNQLDLYRAWNAFSMLQERLRKRRRIKDGLYVVSNTAGDDIDADTIAGLVDRCAHNKGRKYTPRVLKELFC